MAHASAPRVSALLSLALLLATIVALSFSVGGDSVTRFLSRDTLSDIFYGQNGPDHRHVNDSQHALPRDGITVRRLLYLPVDRSSSVAARRMAHNIKKSEKFKSYYRARALTEQEIGRKTSYLRINSHETDH